MRVRSPIGDLPFTLTGVELRGGRLVVRGELGAWRSEVEVEPADVLALARAARTPILVAAALVAGALAARGRRAR